jgi:hypothetical protein
MRLWGAIKAMFPMLSILRITKSILPSSVQISSTLCLAGCTNIIDDARSKRNERQCIVRVSFLHGININQRSYTINEYQAH